MKETIISVTAIVCLTILGIFIISYMPGASKLLYGITAIICGLTGFEIPRIPRAVNNFRARRKK